MNSFNHYAYGAIGQWMYEGIAGISALEPGYKMILIAPTPGDQLDFASAEYNSIYGLIASDWKKLTNGLELKVTIPPNTSARIIIPVDQGAKVLLDDKELADNPNVKLVERNDTKVVLEVIPGNYTFKTQNAI